jgi:hypothetical protein
MFQKAILTLLPMPEGYIILYFEYDTGFLVVKKSSDPNYWTIAYIFAKKLCKQFPLPNSIIVMNGTDYFANNFQRVLAETYDISVAVSYPLSIPVGDNLAALSLNLLEMAPEFWWLKFKRGVFDYNNSGGDSSPISQMFGSMWDRTNPFYRWDSENALIINSLIDTLERIKNCVEGPDVIPIEIGEIGDAPRVERNEIGLPPELFFELKD